MKKYIFIGLLAIFAFSSCNKQSSKGHDNHGAGAHNHVENEQHTEDDGHDHVEGESCSSPTLQSENHADEIIMTKEQAQSAGLVVETIQPSTFQQVIKTSGQVLVAQGDESIAVANVAGIVSFNGVVTQGKSVSKGTPLITISSSNIADGNPVERARIAYNVAQKEYERMKPLVESQIVSQKEFAQAEQNYENARITYEAIANGSTSNGVSIKAPINGYVKNILVDRKSVV